MSEATQVEKEFLSSLRALLKGNGNQQSTTRAEPNRVPHWTFFFLLLFAVDLTAVAFLLGGWAKWPFLDLLIKSVPAILGVVLVSHLNWLRKKLVDVANRPPFRVATSIAAFGLIVPQIFPYHVPLRIPVGAAVSLNGVPVHPHQIAGDSVRKLWVKGFKRHTISISEYDAQGTERTDDFTIGRRSLFRSALRSFMWDKTDYGKFNLRLTTLSVIPLMVPDSAVVVAIRGDFPELYLRRGLAAYEARSYSGNDHEFIIRLPKGKGPQPLRLPEGTYRFRFLTNGRCWSDTISHTIRHQEINSPVDMLKLACVP